MKSSISNSKLINQAERIMWISIFWVIISILQFFTSYSTLLNFEVDLNDTNPFRFFIGSIVTGLSAGLIGGTSMVFHWEKWLRAKSYKRSLTIIFCSYSIIYIIVSMISSLFFLSGRLNTSYFHSKTWLAAWESIFSLHEITGYIFWLFIVIVTLIAMLVNDKYGPGVFVSFLLGKYFHPRREERIFMFLDLRSSTTIAEKLGEEKYFNFLRQVYKKVTPSILNHWGEIYQYVGDEIVVSWKPEKGFLNANCLECFFDIQSLLKSQMEYFEEKFGVIPEFKAGLHFGHVMAGEIGVVKRDIAFSGDVLNTASRIQEQCNPLGVDLLVSKLLSEKIGLTNQNYQLKEVGTIHLKGKIEEMTLYTV